MISLIIVSVLLTPRSGAAEGEVPTPPPTATPFLPPAGPPLQIGQDVSASQVHPGDELVFRLLVDVQNPTEVSIRVQNGIDPQLDVLDADASAGDCDVGSSVTCTVQAQSGQPATVTIKVAVRANAQGSVTNQAAASVNGLTAASERQIITIINQVPSETVADAPSPTVPIPSAAAIPAEALPDRPTPPTAPPPTATQRPNQHQDHHSSPENDEVPPSATPLPPSATAIPVQASPTPMSRRAAPPSDSPPIPPSDSPPGQPYPPGVTVPF